MKRSKTATKTAAACDHFATIRATIGTGLKWCAVASPLAPAIWINLDQASGKGGALTAFAIGSVLAAAMAIELVIIARAWSARVTWGAVAALFLALNIANAIGNSAGHSGDARDNRAAIKSTADAIKARIASLSQRRAALATVAGEDAAESIAAELAAKKAEGSRAWRATEGCAADKIASPAARELCVALARLDAKHAAALKRDAIDLDLAAERAKDTGAAPSVDDPKVEAMTVFVEMLGFEVTKQGRVAIATGLDFGIGIGVEILSALFPAGILSLFAGVGHAPAKTAPAKVAAKPAAVRRELAPDEQPQPVAAEDAGLAAFYARHLEALQGEHVTATALFAVWRAYCETQGIVPGSAKAFSLKMQKRAIYERNSGRPRYCGIRLKEADTAPQLRVIAARN